MKFSYSQLTIERAISFAGHGHVQTFDIGLGHDIQRDGETVIVRKSGDAVHFPWARVICGVPIVEPVPDLHAARASIDQAFQAWAEEPSLGTSRIIGVDRRPPMRAEPATFERAASEAASFNEALGAVLDDAAGPNAMKYVGIDRAAEPSQAHAEGDDHAAEKGKLEEGPRGKHSNRDRRR